MKPANLTNFETQARRLRYQALGRACRGQGIRHLLTAHHRDDQVETALLGLANGNAHRYMKDRTPIPECWGIHGVHESGLHEVAVDNSGSHVKSPGHRDLEFQPVRSAWRRMPEGRLIEAGQTHLLRPLLEIDKCDLIEICDTAGIPWEEDRTNIDLSRTPRNVVRFLLKVGAVPKALDKVSLLGLTERQKHKSKAIEEAINQLNDSCEVISLDIRSGVLKVRLPSFLSTESPKHSTGFEQQVAAGFVERLLQSVSPAEFISHGSLREAADSIFPEVSSSTTRTVTDDPFTAGSVQIQRFQESTQEQESSVVMRSGQQAGDFGSLINTNLWMLYRQPFHRNDSPLLEYPPVKSWSEWRLWDGRFWIRICNLTNQFVGVRALTQVDLWSLKSTLDAQRWRQLNHTLRDAAPAKVRWTLPVILQLPFKKGDAEKVIAMPSLGKVGDMRETVRYSTDELTWDLRYKQVPLRPTKTSGFSHCIAIEPHLLRTWDDKVG